MSRLEEMRVNIAAFEASYLARIKADEWEDNALKAKLRRTSARGPEGDDGCAAWFFFKPAPHQDVPMGRRKLSPKVIDYIDITRGVVGR